MIIHKYLRQFGNPDWSKASHMTSLYWVIKTGLSLPGMCFEAAFHLWCLPEYLELYSTQVLGTLHLPVQWKSLGLCMCCLCSQLLVAHLKSISNCTQSVENFSGSFNFNEGKKKSKQTEHALQNQDGWKKNKSAMSFYIFNPFKLFWRLKLTQTGSNFTEPLNRK